jgi:Fic family protein
LREHFEVINHNPFIDGNGRTGRLLLNLLLFKQGYPPAVIEKTNRRQYYKVLGEADGGNDRGLVNLVARACERSLRMFVEAATPVKAAPAPDDRWVMLKPLPLTADLVRST